MTKNYFTDEQVQKIYSVSGLDDELSEEPSLYKIKKIMNLAVGAAIGEKLGFRVEHFDGGYELNFNETWQKVKEQLPLYSVKELENKHE